MYVKILIQESLPSSGSAHSKDRMDGNPLEWRVGSWGSEGGSLYYSAKHLIFSRPMIKIATTPVFTDYTGTRLAVFTTELPKNFCRLPMLRSADKQLNTVFTCSHQSSHFAYFAPFQYILQVILC